MTKIQKRYETNRHISISGKNTWKEYLKTESQISQFLRTVGCKIRGMSDMKEEFELLRVEQTKRSIRYGHYSKYHTYLPVSGFNETRTQNVREYTRLVSTRIGHCNLLQLILVTEKCAMIGGEESGRDFVILTSALSSLQLAFNLLQPARSAYHMQILLHCHHKQISVNKMSSRLERNVRK
jgi:hypothetical protein